MRLNLSPGVVAVHLCAGAIVRRKALRCSSCFSPCRRRYPYDTHSARVSRLRGQTIRDLLTEPSSGCAAQLARLTRTHGSRCLFKPRRQGIPSLNPERKRPHRPSTAPAEPTSHFQESENRKHSLPGDTHRIQRESASPTHRTEPVLPSQWNGRTVRLAV